jgi:pimeloyl-ACP methyl ester carboxylesterase
MGSRTQYVKSGDVSIAYRVEGEGDLTLLSIPGAISHMALEDLNPATARIWDRYSRFCRSVRFDKRGTGLSDRGTSALAIADQVPDVEAVRCAVGAERVALSGLSQGAAVALLYTLTHRGRVSHLILSQGLVCDGRDPYAPLAQSEPLTRWDEFFTGLDGDFAAFTQSFARTCFPEVPEEGLEGFTNYLQATASPDTFKALWQGIVGLDLRPCLGEITVPTLVIHSSGDQHHPVSHGRYAAEHIPNSRFVELASKAHIPAFDERATEQLLAAIEEFLTGRVESAAARRFATVLFTDIVDSTVRQRQHGDQAWKSILDDHHRGAQRLISQFGGRVVELRLLSLA